MPIPKYMFHAIFSSQKLERKNEKEKAFKKALCLSHLQNILLWFPQAPSRHPKTQATKALAYAKNPYQTSSLPQTAILNVQQQLLLA